MPDGDQIIDDDDNDGLYLNNCNSVIKDWYIAKIQPSSVLTSAACSRLVKMTALIIMEATSKFTQPGLRSSLS